MNTNNKATKVFRLTMSEPEILAALEALQYQNSEHGLDRAAKNVMIKFKKLAIEFEHGTKNPAYIATGVKKESSVNMSSLGASEEELLLANASEEQKEDAKFEAGYYNSLPQNKVLPWTRFIGKTWQDISNEVNEVNGVSSEIVDSDSSPTDEELFKSL